jgi:hypothetical protein
VLDHENEGTTVVRKVGQYSPHNVVCDLCATTQPTGPEGSNFQERRCENVQSHELREVVHVIMQNKIMFLRCYIF